MKLYISKRILLYFCLMVVGISGFFFTVILPQPAGFYAFVAMAALGGFGVSANIWLTKKSKKQLICPSGSNCNIVVTSRYSKFFGVPLEYLGMLYFAVIFISYLVLVFSPQSLLGTPHTLIIILSLCAFFFSSYLLFVQAFLLRAWCIWCVLAAMFSMTIFFVSLISLQPAIAFLESIENLLVMAEFLGFALGMGGSSAAVFLFFRFLKDSDIDEKELGALQGISELVWIGVGLVLMSQFALYTVHPVMLAQSGAFLAKIVSLFCVVIAGAVLMIIFAPFLAYIPFQKKPKEDKRSSLAALRRPTLVAGGLALSSWYFAFVMNFIPEYDFAGLLLAYGTVLALAVLASMLWEFQYRRQPAQK